MKHLAHSMALMGLAILAACSDTPLDTATGVATPGTGRQEQTFPGTVSRPVTVMSRNLYVGADLDPVIGALASPDGSDDVPALLAAIDVLQRTSFPARVRGLAAEIAANRPHLVGLQEVSTIDIDLTPLGLSVVVHQDFLAALQAELVRRGLHYRIAASVRNVEAAPLPGIGLIDRDVLLADADRVVLQGTPVERNFSLNIGDVAPGVVLKRGWVAVTAQIGSARYTVASTHLESGARSGLAELRAGQVSELLASLPADSPVIVVGDFNDIPGSLMYQAVVASGFTDAWATLRPGLAGFTCCHLPDLSDSRGELDQRIDYVFARGFGTRGRPVHGGIQRVGLRLVNRVQGPAGLIWPSDHAGLVASLWDWRPADPGEAEPEVNQEDE